MKKIFSLIIIAIILSFPMQTNDNAISYAEANAFNAEESFHATADAKPQYARKDLKMTLPEKYEAKTRQILAEMPENLILSLTKVQAEYGEDKRRGLASFRSIYLGVDAIKTDREFRRVFIHELGHVADLGGLKETEQKVKSKFKDGSRAIWETDPSLDFYRICWTNEKKRNNKCGTLDYVSRYAKTDAFEDFAESFLLFLENNASFKQMAKTNEILAKKYDFFANVVFQGEFKKTAPTKNLLPLTKRVWDLTRV